MKLLTALLLTAAPAAAQAMEMHGGMPGRGPGIGIHLAVALYALLAALGYWVLQHSAREAANYVKRAGQTLGWALIVIGLLGVLCGLASHARSMGRRMCRCPGTEMMEREEDMKSDKTGNMPMMKTDCPMKGQMMKKPEAAPQKK